MPQVDEIEIPIPFPVNTIEDRVTQKTELHIMFYKEGF